MTRSIKQLILSTLPIGLIFGLGLLAWQYYTGKLNFEPDSESNFIRSFVAEDPAWWTQWHPEEDNPNLNYSAKLPKLGLEGIEERKRKLNSLSLSLQQLNPESENTLLVKAFLQQTSQAAVSPSSFRTPFLLEPFDGEHLRIEDLLLIYHLIDDQSDGQAYLSRMRSLPSACKQWEKYLLALSEQGELPLRPVLQATRNQLANWSTPEPLAHPLYQALARKAGRADMTALNEYDILGYLEEAAELLREEIQPSFMRLVETCDSLLVRMPPLEKDLPYQVDSQFYRSQLGKYSALEGSPSQLHQRALKAVTDWQTEIESYSDSLDLKSSFPEESLKDHSDPNRELSRDTYLKEWFGLRRNMSKYTKGVMDTVPMERLVFWPSVPGRMRPQTVSYFPAALDADRRAARLRIDFSTIAGWSDAERELMVYEQIVPGTHLLITRQLMAGERSDFRRVLIHPALAEGWKAYALYSVDHDLAAFYHRPAIRLAYLQQQQLKAIRLVIDTGLNGLGWTPRKAEKYVSAHTQLNPSQIDEEILRCLSRPGQAAAAFTGYEFLLSLRRELKQPRGSNFYLQAFHNKLLYEGALPPTLLRKAMMGS